MAFWAGWGLGRWKDWSHICPEDWTQFLLTHVNVYPILKHWLDRVRLAVNHFTACSVFLARFHNVQLDLALTFLSATSMTLLQTTLPLHSYPLLSLCRLILYMSVIFWSTCSWHWHWKCLVGFCWALEGVWGLAVVLAFLILVGILDTWWTFSVVFLCYSKYLYFACAFLGVHKFLQVLTIACSLLNLRSSLIISD